MSEASRSRNGRGGLIWGLAAFVVLGAGFAVFWLLLQAGAREGGAAPQPPLVRGAEVTPASRLFIRQTGFVRPRREVTVAAEVSGRIEAVGENFRLGGRVEDGDLLVRVERERFRADMERAKAAVDQAEAALAEARVNRQRQEELEGEEFASEAALQQAIVAVAAAEADLAAARAELARARIALDDATVTAPFDALVTEENAAIGELLQPGAAVGTLVAANAVEVLMGLTPRDIALLGDPSRAIGGTVTLSATDPPGEALGEGTVVDVDPRVVGDTRTVALVVRVPEPFDLEPRPLRVDELVEVALPVSLEGRGAVEVPPEAMKGRATVWRVAEGVLDRITAEPLERNEERVILSGDALRPGDTVMVSDLPAPFEGKKVRLAEDGTPEAGASAPEAAGRDQASAQR